MELCKMHNYPQGAESDWNTPNDFALCPSPYYTTCHIVSRKLIQSTQYNDCNAPPVLTPMSFVCWGQRLHGTYFCFRKGVLHTAGRADGLKAGTIAKLKGEIWWKDGIN
ncbi:hypothetical protein WG66_001674 [Moniliophthora roreri]|nr:hypothetical protein WG66_001674 [Moniliophthora roreri]